MANLLTANQVAEQLAIDAATVRLYARQGKIACHRIGTRVCFAPADVEDYLRRTRREARPQTADEWFAMLIAKQEAR